MCVAGLHFFVKHFISLVPTNNSILLKEKMAYNIVAFPLIEFIQYSAMPVVVPRTYLVKEIRSLNKLLCTTKICYITWVYHTFCKMIVQIFIPFVLEIQRGQVWDWLRWICRAGSVSCKQYRQKKIKVAPTYIWENHHTSEGTISQIQLCVFFHCQNNSSLLLLHSCLDLTSSIRSLRLFTALGKDALSAHLEEAKYHTGSQAVVKFPLRTMKGELFAFVCVLSAHKDITSVNIYLSDFIFAWNTSVKIQTQATNCCNFFLKLICYNIWSMSLRILFFPVVF